jgi:YggT family protein
MLQLDLLTNSLSYCISIYTVLIIVRILLTWFSTADWANQIMSVLSPITDPYLDIFRSFIPPLGMIDISPMVAIFVLQILAELL